MSEVHVHELTSLDGVIDASGRVVVQRHHQVRGDELHLFVFPLTRAEGPRLFPSDAAQRKFALASTESYDNGVIYASYRPESA